MAEAQLGRLVAALGFAGRARVLAVVVHGPADEARRRHHLTPVAAKIAAEGVVAAVLLSAHIKGEERLTMEIVADTPKFDLVVDVNGDGTLRARMRPTGEPDSAAFTGIFAVLKSLGRKELYRGFAKVEGQPFEGALQTFLDQSQQGDGVVRVHAEVEDGEVTFASGLFVERLPETSHEDFHAQIVPLLQGDLRELMTAFAFGQLGGGPVEVLGGEDLRFACTCSRERVSGTLKALGPEEILSILDDPGFAEVTCQFCNEVYHLDAAELQTLLAPVSE